MLKSFTDKEQDARRKVIGGSDAPVIYHKEFFGKTVHDLWAEKTGRKEPEDLDDKLQVQMGTWTEELNRLWFERKTGLKVEISDKLCYMQRHDDYDFIGGNLDGVVIDGEGEYGVWEAKHTSPFNKHDLKEFYNPQLQHLMMVTGYNFCFLSVFIGNNRWKKERVARDEYFIDRLLKMEVSFWQNVELDLEPAK